MIIIDEYQHIALLIYSTVEERDSYRLVQDTCTGQLAYADDHERKDLLEQVRDPSSCFRGYVSAQSRRMTAIQPHQQCRDTMRHKHHPCQTIRRRQWLFRNLKLRVSFSH